MFFQENLIGQRSRGVRLGNSPCSVVGWCSNNNFGQCSFIAGLGSGSRVGFWLLACTRWGGCSRNWMLLTMGDHSLLTSLTLCLWNKLSPELFALSLSLLWDTSKSQCNCYTSVTRWNLWIYSMNKDSDSAVLFFSFYYFFFPPGLAWSCWKLKACVPSVPTILLWLRPDWTVAGSGSAGLLKSLRSGLPWQNLWAGQDHIQAVCHVYPGHRVFCHSSDSSRQVDSEGLEQRTTVSNIWSLVVRMDRASTQWFYSGLSRHRCWLFSP